MTRDATDAFRTWFSALEDRHLADLTFQEVRRAVQALSVGYVERRRSRAGRALESAGKRAAFALFYAPLHFLLIREIVVALRADATKLTRIVDLGCGTGAAGAAWALSFGTRPEIVGVERNSWAADEARWTLQALGLHGKVHRTDLARFDLPGKGAGIMPGKGAGILPGESAGILAAFAVNELSSSSRRKLLERITRSARGGASALIVEPIARRLTPWWGEWTAALEDLGGRSDDWRFAVSQPESLRLMDKAAGLDHRELTGRSIWIPGERFTKPSHSIDL